MTQPAALFRKHPLDTTVEVNGESLPSPYHVYGGALACLSGTVAADIAADLLADEPFVPLSDATGRALSIVWVGDFTEASLGAHREVQISLLATPAPVPAVEANPLAVQRALFSVPGIVNVCHGLWNDTSRVVSFNREHLHLDAAEASIDITRGTDAWTFGAADVTSAPIVSGRFAAPGRPAGALGRSLVTLLGPKAMVRILISRTAKAKVANTTRPGVQGDDWRRPIRREPGKGFARPTPPTRWSYCTLAMPTLVSAWARCRSSTACVSSTSGRAHRSLPLEESGLLKVVPARVTGPRLPVD